MTHPLIGDIAPDFTAATTDGTIQFHQWIGDDKRLCGEVTHELGSWLARRRSPVRDTDHVSPSTPRCAPRIRSRRTSPEFHDGCAGTAPHPERGESPGEGARGGAWSHAVHPSDTAPGAHPGRPGAREP